MKPLGTNDIPIKDWITGVTMKSFKGSKIEREPLTESRMV